MMTREEFLKQRSQADWRAEKEEEMRILKEKMKLFGGLTKPNLDRLADELGIRLEMAVEIMQYFFALKSNEERMIMKNFLEFYLDSLKKRIHDFAREAVNEQAD